MVLIPENQYSTPHNHPRLISEAQTCHQHVIEHTSSPEATGPSPPHPLLDEGAESSISPNSVKWCRKQEKEGHSSQCLSILSLQCWPPVKLHLDALIYLSVNGEGGRGGGGGIGASSQSPLPSQMHNSVFLSQQPALRRAQLPQPCGQQSANMKEEPTLLFLKAFWLYTLSVILVWFIQLLHPWRETRTPTDELGTTFVFVRVQPQNLAEEVCRHRCGLSKWHWSSLTSHWWLVLLLLLRGPPLSLCTVTLRCPQYATKEGSMEDKSTGWLFLFLMMQCILATVFKVNQKTVSTPVCSCLVTS